MWIELRRTRTAPGHFPSVRRFRGSEQKFADRSRIECAETRDPARAAIHSGHRPEQGICAGVRLLRARLRSPCPMLMTGIFSEQPLMRGAHTQAHEKPIDRAGGNKKRSRDRRERTRVLARKLSTSPLAHARGFANRARAGTGIIFGTASHAPWRTQWCMKTVGIGIGIGTGIGIQARIDCNPDFDSDCDPDTDSDCEVLYLSLYF